jgi:hypothetical protein
MNAVLPPLLAVANLECDLEILENEVGDESSDEDDDDVKKVRLQLPGLGEQTVRIHTSMIEDKELASTIILSVLDTLGGKLHKFLQPITEMAVALLDFAATPTVRENGAAIIGSLSAAFKESEPNSLANFVHYVVPKVVKVAREENDMDVLGAYLSSIAKVLDSAPQVLQPALCMELSDFVHKALQDSVQRRVALNKKEKEEHDDEDAQLVIEGEDETEQYLLQECNTIIQSLIKNCVQTFTPIFVAQYLPTVHVLLGQDMDNFDHKTGLAMLCDFVEFGGAACLPHLGEIAQTVLEYSHKEDPAVAQSAYFGMKVVADMCKVSFPQPHPESVSFGQAAAARIAAYLSSPVVTDEDYEHTTANVISASLHVIDLLVGSGVDTKSLFTQTLNALPSHGDMVESQRNHELLLRWVIEGHPSVNAVHNSRQVIVNAIRRAPRGAVNAETQRVLNTL